ncbi:hypothetical protein DPMN_040647 [Dreissena polymorpha]|uniref:Uncharacterized protein n=1 Tax=Dreissena polymorpha TaxID=45954 RepID=A0A9D4CVR5_DREPO|nr:hypothetical protein DPMN_040647 [Dreissena polymorpha]
MRSLPSDEEHLGIQHDRLNTIGSQYYSLSHIHLYLQNDNTGLIKNWLMKILKILWPDKISKED